ncbi:hypothetical protein AC578_4091 [Pseudocercospora eumusae]|uniref:Uncharacterized protein n=1 Tax=Pseudocercospora eumusae TaxID=321146 RepID=A0A139HDG7_9PEZI|nr:hypothetical protein AC578_4091 [Pseudocercospora eumusae]
MDDARQAVESHLAKAGHHDTTVHEKVAPAVTRETITRTEHEEVTTAVDQEIHQDHYHVSVQPITEEEYREEQHHHTLLPLEQENFEHDDPAEVQSVLAEVASQFRNEVNNVTAEKTTATLPDIEGMHVHHHVFETIQPVITKRTFEPHVYHVIRQRHQIHHNRAIYHAPSTLPALTLADFLKNGGVLNGREERYDAFEGEPRSVGEPLSAQAPADLTREPTAFGSLDRVLSDASGTQRTPTAPPERAPTVRFEPAPTAPTPTAPLSKAQTEAFNVPQSSERVQTQRPTAPLERAQTAPPEQTPTAPVAPTVPLEPTPTAPAATLAVEPPPVEPAPAPAPAPAPPVRIGSADAASHPLMNPSTSLPQHHYRNTAHLPRRTASARSPSAHRDE